MTPSASGTRKIRHVFESRWGDCGLAVAVAVAGGVSVAVAVSVTAAVAVSVTAAVAVSVAAAVSVTAAAPGTGDGLHLRLWRMLRARDFPPRRGRLTTSPRLADLPATPSSARAALHGSRTAMHEPAGSVRGSCATRRRCGASSRRHGRCTMARRAFPSRSRRRDLAVGVLVHGASRRGVREPAPPRARASRSPTT